MAGRLADYLQRVLGNPFAALYASSSFMLAAVLNTAIGGIAFWALAARMAPPATVGVASAVVSSINLLTLVSNLGLGAGIIRFGAAQRERAVALANSVTTLAQLVALLVSAAFIAGAPLWAGDLAPLRADLLLALAFGLFVAANVSLLFQDHAMLAQQNPAFVLWRSVAITWPSLGLVYLGLRVWPESAAAIWLAYWLPVVVTLGVTSWLVLPRRLPGYRLFGRPDRQLLRTVGGYALANYVANSLRQAPVYLVPVVILGRRSAADAAFFFFPWMFVGFFFTATRAINISLFAEASRNEHQPFGVLARHALSVIALPLLAGGGALWLAGEWALRLFGAQYVDLPLLRVLIVSTLPFALNEVLLTWMLVRKHLRWLIIFAGGLSILSVEMVSLGAGFSLWAAGAGWLAAQSLACVIGLAAAAAQTNHRFAWMPMGER
jgi:O-antigen/teichoic acid export membrane protein